MTLGCDKIGMRLIYIERPDLLAAIERSKYDRAVAARITSDAAEVPWPTLPKSIAELDKLLNEGNPSHTTFLQEHRHHLSNRLETAMQVLSVESMGGRIVRLRQQSPGVRTLLMRANTIEVA
jgi:hypothetical protein